MRNDAEVMLHVSLGRAVGSSVGMKNGEMADKSMRGRLEHERGTPSTHNLRFNGLILSIRETGGASNTACPSCSNK